MNPKIVFTDYVPSPIDTATRMQIYKDCSVESITFAWGECHFAKGDSRFNTLDHARKIGLGVDIVHLDYKDNNLMWLDDARGDLVVKQLLKHLAEMHAQNIKVGVTHLTYDMIPPPHRNLDCREFRKSLTFARSVA